MIRMHVTYVEGIGHLKEIVSLFSLRMLEHTPFNLPIHSTTLMSHYSKPGLTRNRSEDPTIATQC